MSTVERGPHHNCLLPKGRSFAAGATRSDLRPPSRWIGGRLQPRDVQPPLANMRFPALWGSKSPENQRLTEKLCDYGPSANRGNQYFPAPLRIGTRCPPTPWVSANAFDVAGSGSLTGSPFHGDLSRSSRVWPQRLSSLPTGSWAVFKASHGTICRFARVGNGARTDCKRNGSGLAGETWDVPPTSLSCWR